MQTRSINAVQDPDINIKREKTTISNYGYLLSAPRNSVAYLDSAALRGEFFGGRIILYKSHDHSIIYNNNRQIIIWQTEPDGYDICKH